MKSLLKEFGTWMIGFSLLAGIMALALHSARLPFGLLLTYVWPGIALNFCIQPTRLPPLDRFAWAAATSLLIMPTVLFVLTALGLHFTPVMQMGIGLTVTILGSVGFAVRLLLKEKIKHQ